MDIVVSGIRPTGNLHLGNYFGAVRAFTQMQNEYNCFFFIADWHSLTTHPHPDNIVRSTNTILAEYLACGIDPEKATIYIQSDVREVVELYLYLNMNAYLGELERTTSFKEKARQQPDNVNAGLLTYPSLMAADILMHKAVKVPVGKDQLPHLEQTRVVADRFEARYGHPDGADEPVFPRPQGLLSEAETVLGLDGAKMSKSRGNTIELRMSADQTAKLIRKAVTDSDRRIAFDPANRPEVSNLVLLAAMAQGREPAAVAEEIGDGGAGALKKLVTESVNDMLAPIRARRAELEADPGYVRGVLRRGIERATERAEATLAEVREAMNMTY